MAGPVAVAVFGIKNDYKIKKFPKSRDSKKMTLIEREYWFEVFKREVQKGNVYFSYSFSSNSFIDRKGIVPAISQAMNKCLKNLEANSLLNSKSKILLDGALKAPIKFKNQKTIIRGDEKEIVIACASIVAKVMRDDLMKKLSKTYPLYGFHQHKGYGTKSHRKLISKHGLSSIHRKTFCKI